MREKGDSEAAPSNASTDRGGDDNDNCFRLGFKFQHMFYGGGNALSRESYLCTVNCQSALTACFADDVGT
jgi:hypothetical protein